MQKELTTMCKAKVPSVFRDSTPGKINICMYKHLSSHNVSTEKCVDKWHIPMFVILVLIVREIPL